MNFWDMDLKKHHKTNSLVENTYELYNFPLSYNDLLYLLSEPTDELENLARLYEIFVTGCYMNGVLYIVELRLLSDNYCGRF